MNPENKGACISCQKETSPSGQKSDNQSNEIVTEHLEHKNSDDKSASACTKKEQESDGGKRGRTSTNEGNVPSKKQKMTNDTREPSTPPKQVRASPKSTPIERKLSDGTIIIDTPKSGVRKMDLKQQLAKKPIATAMSPRFILFYFVLFTFLFSSFISSFCGHVLIPFFALDLCICIFVVLSQNSIQFIFIITSIFAKLHSFLFTTEGKHEKKRVNFKEVQIRFHNRRHDGSGGVPSSGGYPLGLDWSVSQELRSPLSLYEKKRSAERKGGIARIMIYINFDDCICTYQ